LLNLMENRPDLVNNLLMSDEAHFHLTGAINRQNFRYWSMENLRELHQRPLHISKVTVWCAVSSFGIIGPYFFQDDDNGQAFTISAECYTNMLEHFLAPIINCLPQHEALWFQQDRATAHTACISMTTICNLFPHRVISWFADVSWPPCSPDLSPPDFFSLGVSEEQSVRHTASNPWRS
jgi:hypothetical protein